MMTCIYGVFFGLLSTQTRTFSLQHWTVATVPEAAEHPAQCSTPPRPKTSRLMWLLNAAAPAMERRCGPERRGEGGRGCFGSN